MEKLVQVRNVSFRYGAHHVLNKINFEVCKKDFVAIIGANGTGKSTLLKLLLGDLVPANGQIYLLGQELHTFKNWPKIGYAPQSSVSITGNFPATVEEVVLSNLYAQIGFLRFPKRIHKEKVMAALAQTGMSPYANRLISQLSGGQLQRVMIARVLTGEPELMLLDEPTTGIDPEASASLYEMLSEINKNTGLTIMMVTHEINRSWKYVNRFFYIEGSSLAELNREQIQHKL